MNLNVCSKFFFFSDENFQIIRKLVEDVGNLFENANQSMVPQSNNHHYDDEEIRVRFQDMDKVNDICVNKINNSWWCNLFYFAPCELPHSKSVVCPPAHLCWRANSLSFFLPLSFVTCTNFTFSHRFFRSLSFRLFVYWNFEKTTTTTTGSSDTKTICTRLEYGRWRGTATMLCAHHQRNWKILHCR